MAQRSTAAVAGDFALFGPADGLLVDEGNGGLGLGLFGRWVLAFAQDSVARKIFIALLFPIFQVCFVLFSCSFEGIIPQ